MVRATDNLERQLRLYESQSDAWRPDRQEVSIRELQQVIAFANFLYDRIKRVDEECSAEVAAAGRTPSEEDARAVEGLYAAWARKAEVDLRRASEFEGRGQHIGGLDRFRQAYYEARATLSVPAERARAAARHAQAGRTRPLGDIRDELRRQTGA